MSKWQIEADASGFRLSRDGASFTVPATPAGIKVLNTILLAWNAGDKIGSPGFPFQAQIDQMVAEWKRAHPPKEPDFDIDLEELGLR